MIAQYGENAPAGSLGSRYQKLSGNFGWGISSRILIRRDKPERMVARVIMILSKNCISKK